MKTLPTGAPSKPVTRSDLEEKLREFCEASILLADAPENEETVRFAMLRALMVASSMALYLEDFLNREAENETFSNAVGDPQR